MLRDPLVVLSRLIILAGVLFVIYWLGSQLAGVLFPVVVSLIIAYLLDPLIDKLEAKGISRTFGILIVLTIILTVGFLFVLFFYPVVKEQILHLTERLPTLAITFQENIIPWLTENLGFALPTDMADALSQYGENVKSALPEILKKVGNWLVEAIVTTTAIVSSLLNVVLIPLFTFYFLRDFDKMKAALVPYIPPAKKEFILSRATAIDEVVGNWFRGQVQVASLLALLYSFGFGLVFHLTGLDIKTGIIVGILTGMLSIIPYVGPITGCVLSILFALLDWHGFSPFIGIAIVFVIVQFLEGYVLTPRIVGEKLGLSPVAVILALLVGGTLAGLAGMLFALPITGALKLLTADLLHLYQNSEWFQHQPQNKNPSKRKRKPK